MTTANCLPVHAVCPEDSREHITLTAVSAIDMAASILQAGFNTLVTLSHNFSDWALVVLVILTNGWDIMKSAAHSLWKKKFEFEHMYMSFGYVTTLSETEPWSKNFSQE